MAGTRDAATRLVRVEGTDTSFEVAPGERLLAAARRAGAWLPFECGWGSCGTCKVTVLEGETELLHPDAPSFDPRDVRRRRVLSCQSTPTTDLRIKVTRVADGPSEERPVRDHVGRLVAHEELGPGLARVRFVLDVEAAHRPGQHAVLDLGAHPDGGHLRRCYSLAGPPGTREVSFIAKRYAGRPGSNRLFALVEGEAVAMELPYGDMFVRAGDGPVVLVAGGTGISAILAMAEQLAAERSTRPVHVFYGAGSPAELVCWDELEVAVRSLPDGHLHGALLSAPPGWAGTEGFVTTALAARLVDQRALLTDATFHVAGPPVMTDATLALLREHGVDITRVHFDSFG